MNIDIPASVDTILEPACSIPIRDRVDVLVAGGGLGGISAAMAAARAGARTLLVERNGFLGGVATAGMCCSVFNCYYTADHRLGVTGNALQVADALAEVTGYGRKWHAHKGHIIYDVEAAKRVLAGWCSRRARQAGEYPQRIGMHDTLDACQMHAVRDLGVVHLVTGFVALDDLDIGKISRAMDDGRKMAYAVTDFFQRRVPGFERATMIATADDLGIRVSRCLDGDFRFTRAMKENPTTFVDAIGRGVVERDIRKHPGPNAWGVQTFTSDFFHIPCRCLLPRVVDGLLMGAGRSVSSEDPWLLRVMALTMVVGQGAEVATVLSAAVLSATPDGKCGLNWRDKG